MVIPTRLRSSNGNACVSFGPRKLVLWLILLVHVGISAYLALELPIWRDEAASLGTTSGGILDTVRRAVLYELQPPAYFLVLRLWRALSDSIVAARALSVLLSAALVLLMCPLTRRYASAVDPTLVLAAICLNPFLIYAATEIRLYAFAMVLVSLNLLFYHDSYLGEPAADGSIPKRIGFVFMSTLAVYTQYYLAFLVFAELLAVVAVRNRTRQALGVVITDFGWILILCLPLVGIIPLQMTNHTDPSQLDLTLIQALRYVLARGVDMIIPHLQEYPDRLGRAVRYVAFVILVASIFAARRRIARRTAITGAMVALLLILYVAVARFVTGSPGMQIRHMAGVFPVTVLFLFGIASAVDNRLGHRYVATVVLAVVSFGVCIPGTHERFGELTKPGSFDEVAAYVHARERVGDTVFVYPPNAFETFKFYYSGDNHPLALPEAIAYDSPFAYASPNRRASELRESISRIHSVVVDAPPPRRVWLITDKRRETAMTSNGTMSVDAPLSAATGNPVEAEEFNGTLVRLFAFERRSN